MTFDYGDYLRECFSQPMQVIVLLAAVFLYLIYAAIRNSRKQPPRNRLAWFAVLLFVPILLSAPALPKQISTLVRTNGFAILQDRDTEPLSLTGTIEGIKMPERNADTRFTYDGKHRYGTWLIIGGTEYYAVTTGDLAIGDTVTLQYLPKSRCVLYLAPVDSTIQED